MDEKIVHGPTGETCLDLPSPYEAHKIRITSFASIYCKNKKAFEWSTAQELST